MIKLENIVLTSPEQMMFVIEGMRNPMNSWDKIDSYLWPDCYREDYIDEADSMGLELKEKLEIGANDLDLMRRLSKAGTDHRKFMRMMPVYVRITAPLYWWKEFDTYKVGTVRNSCSTMHKIQAKNIQLDDFSISHLGVKVGDKYYEDGECRIVDWYNEIVEKCEHLRLKYLETKDKKYWELLIQLLPSSYNQTSNVMMNYEVLANMYKSRKDHKLDEWVEFCKWIETLPYSELITGEE